VRRIASLAAAALALLPAAAAASPPRLELGARAGAAVPLGDADGSARLDDATAIAFPLWLEASWKVTPRLALGAWGAFAPGVPGHGLRDACDRVAASCSAFGLRTGLRAALTFAPLRGAEPWAALGTGYEWAWQKAGGSTHAWRGFEWLLLEGGAQVRVNPAFAWGPYLSASVGRFEQEVLASGGGSASFALSERTVHAWIEIGVRGTIAF
jgi:hypothetical protein